MYQRLCNNQELASNSALVLLPRLAKSVSLSLKPVYIPQSYLTLPSVRIATSSPPFFPLNPSCMDITFPVYQGEFQPPAWTSRDKISSDQPQLLVFRQQVFSIKCLLSMLMHQQYQISVALWSSVSATPTLVSSTLHRCGPPVAETVEFYTTANFPHHLSDILKVSNFTLGCSRSRQMSCASILPRPLLSKAGPAPLCW